MAHARRQKIVTFAGGLDSLEEGSSLASPASYLGKKRLKHKKDHDEYNEALRDRKRRKKAQQKSMQIPRKKRAMPAKFR